MTTTAAEPTRNKVLNPDGRFGTTNLTALVSKSHQNRSDMETYGHLRWSGSWMEAGMDFGPTKDPMVGEMCMTCFTTKAITGECGYCD